MCAYVRKREAQETATTGRVCVALITLTCMSPRSEGKLWCGMPSPLITFTCMGFVMLVCVTSTCVLSPRCNLYELQATPHLLIQPPHHDTYIATVQLLHSLCESQQSFLQRNVHGVMQVVALIHNNQPSSKLHEPHPISTSCPSSSPQSAYPSLEAPVRLLPELENDISRRNAWLLLTLALKHNLGGSLQQQKSEAL